MHLDSRDAYDWLPTTGGIDKPVCEVSESDRGGQAKISCSVRPVRTSNGFMKMEVLLIVDMIDDCLEAHKADVLEGKRHSVTPQLNVFSQLKIKRLKPDHFPVHWCATAQWLGNSEHHR